MQIWLKRIYEKPSPQDGRRVLVDRLWPRGIAKKDAALDAWLKELAPSDELRQWFGHEPQRWEEFRRRYRAELDAMRGGEDLSRLQELAGQGRVTLLYAAKDEAHNNAVVLKDFLEQDG